MIVSLILASFGIKEINDISTKGNVAGNELQAISCPFMSTPAGLK